MQNKKRIRFETRLEQAVAGSAGDAHRVVEGKPPPQYIVGSGIQYTLDQKSIKWAGIWQRDQGIKEHIIIQLHGLRNTLPQNGRLTDIDDQRFLSFFFNNVHSIPLKKKCGMDGIGPFS